jgi:hypothetical protein
MALLHRDGIRTYALNENDERGVPVLRVYARATMRAGMYVMYDDVVVVDRTFNVTIYQQ